MHTHAEKSNPEKSIQGKSRPEITGLEQSFMPPESFDGRATQLLANRSRQVRKLSQMQRIADQSVYVSRKNKQALIQRKLLDHSNTLQANPKAVYDELFDEDYWESFLNKGWEPMEENIVDVIDSWIDDKDSWTYSQLEAHIKGEASKRGSNLFVFNDMGTAFGGGGGFGYPKDKDQTKTGSWGTWTLHNDADGCLDHNPKGFDEPTVAAYGNGSGKSYDITKAPSYSGSLIASRAMHFKWANELATKAGDKSGVGNAPPANCTWHHKKQKGMMQLLDRELHAAFKHKGGFSLWGS
ncbi:MAG: HNH endonuclease [Bacteroidota bacterium]